MPQLINLRSGDNQEYREKALEWASVLSDPEARKYAEEAAELILRRGFDLPALSEVKIKKTRAGVIAARYREPLSFGQSMGRIEVNTHPDVRKAGGYNEGGDGWHSQPNTILHELGHMVDYYMTHLFPKTGKEQIGDRFDKLDESQVKKILSEYGATQAVEFRAELISGILAGKAYPKEFLTAAYLDKYLTDDRGKAIFDMGSGEVPNTTMLEKQFGSMMQALFHEEGASLRVEILGDADVEKFIDTHARVLDNAFVNTPMSDLMRDRLRESDWIFSGMKTFHELNEAFPSMLNEDGTRKPFNQFLNDVQKVDETYNRRYLNAEYNFANASAEMAGRWESFEEDEDRYLLQYRTQNDGAVRPEHAELHGITLPASDSFWDTCYPPNGWNCRCTVVQVLKDKYQETDHNEAMRLGGEAMSKDSKGMFAFNPGKQEKVFPDYNPYTISRCKNCPKAQGNLASGVPDNQLCEACSVLLTKMEKERQEVLSNEDRKHILQSTKEWVANHLPEETLPDGIIAHRAHIQVEGHDLILNKEFFNETFAKNKRNSKLAETMRLATLIEDWAPESHYVRTETGKDHSYNFLVFEGRFGNTDLEYKVKDLPDKIIYTMRIK